MTVRGTADGTRRGTVGTLNMGIWAGTFVCLKTACLCEKKQDRGSGRDTQDL
jgi:hypothetical protein